MASRFPCTVKVVQDGTEVIEYLFGTGSSPGQPRPPMPDLILLDLKMPRMDGLQVLQVMRRVRGNEAGPFPPVVVLTCSDDDESINEAYQLGARGYICKPIVFGDFSQTIRRTLEFWLGVNQPVPERSPVRG